MNKAQKLKQELNITTNNELKVALMLYFQTYEGMDRYDAFRFIMDKNDEEFENTIVEISKKPKRGEYFDQMLKVRERINSTNFDSYKDLKALEKYLDDLSISASPSVQYYCAFLDFFSEE